MDEKEIKDDLVEFVDEATDAVERVAVKTFSAIKMAFKASITAAGAFIEALPGFADSISSGLIHYMPSITPYLSTQIVQYVGVALLVVGGYAATHEAAKLKKDKETTN